MENSFPLFTENNADLNTVIMNKELRQFVEAVLLKIPKEYRLVFSLRQLNELSTAETAELLKISETNVKVRLNRAKAIMLRNAIKKMYQPEDIFEFNLVYCDAIVNKVMKAIKEINQPWKQQ